LAIASPTSGGRSVGIVRSRTQIMEFYDFLEIILKTYCLLSTQLLLNSWNPYQVGYEYTVSPLANKLWTLTETSSHSSILAHSFHNMSFWLCRWQ
jgi:hypothetical protein